MTCLHRSLSQYGSQTLPGTSLQESLHGFLFPGSGPEQAAAGALSPVPFRASLTEDAMFVKLTVPLAGRTIWEKLTGRLIIYGKEIKINGFEVLTNNFF